MRNPDPPTITLSNRQRALPLNLPQLRRETRRAVLRLLPELPPDLTTIDIVFLTPRASALAHHRFLNQSNPTDVITFHHGEILICPAVAETQRHTTGLSLHDEILTYICHGLLHLCGENDQSAAGFRRMARRQNHLRRLARENP